MEKHKTEDKKDAHDLLSEPQHEEWHPAEHREQKMPKPLLALLAAAVIVLLVNQVQIQSLLSMTGMAVSKEETGGMAEDVVGLVISRGSPAVYGNELGVSFENPVAGMDTLKDLDPTYGAKKIQLQGEELARYVKVGSMIACEYCCGAKTLVFGNGQAACGCQHSWAMRGLAAYLIKYHGGEYTDEQILKELAKWKGLFFPKQMVAKMQQQLANGQYTPDIAALLLGMDQEQLKKISASAPPAITEMPNMVGGC